MHLKAKLSKDHQNVIKILVDQVVLSGFEVMDQKKSKYSFDQ